LFVDSAETDIYGAFEVGFKASQNGEQFEK
jgi:hypothetical protein